MRIVKVSGLYSTGAFRRSLRGHYCEKSLIAKISLYNVGKMRDDLGTSDICIAKLPVR